MLVIGKGWKLEERIAVGTWKRTQQTQLHDEEEGQWLLVQRMLLAAALSADLTRLQISAFAKKGTGNM